MVLHLFAFYTSRACFLKNSSAPGVPFLEECAFTKTYLCNAALILGCTLCCTKPLAHASLNSTMHSILNCNEHSWWIDWSRNIILCTNIGSSQALVACTELLESLTWVMARQRTPSPGLFHVFSRLVVYIFFCTVLMEIETAHQCCLMSREHCNKIKMTLDVDDDVFAAFSEHVGFESRTNIAPPPAMYYFKNGIKVNKIPWARYDWSIFPEKRDLFKSMAYTFPEGDDEVKIKFENSRVIKRASELPYRELSLTVT